MRNLLITTAIATSFAGVAFADTENTGYAGPTLGGEVELNFAETAAGDWAGSMGVDLDINAAGLASVDLGLEATEGSDVALDTWTVGTAVAGIGLSFGNDNDVFVGADGEQTLAAPAMTESVKIEVGAAAVAVGFTDWNADITDISNIQGSYTLGNVAGLGLDITAAGDYNMDSENIVVGGEVEMEATAGVSVGSALTYDVDAEAIGYEIMADAFGIEAYVNGDNDEMLQNIGGEYTYAIGGAELTAGAAYNLDSEELTSSVGVSFSF